MAYELLVLDVDGTLMRTDKTISGKTIEEVVRIQQEGVKVAIASGRCTAGILPTAKQIRLDEFGGYIVSYNGGCISNCGRAKLFITSIFPMASYRKFMSFPNAKKRAS